MNSYGNLFYMIYNAFSLRYFNGTIPASQRNYTSFPSYTSLLNQLANKLLDKRARLIINQKETSSYYFTLWNIHHIY